MTFTANPDPVASPFMDRPLHELNDDRQTVTYDKPPVNYGRSIYYSVNLILLVLVPILLILAWGATREVKEDREEKVRVEFCERWAEDWPDLPTPDSCL